MNTSGSLDPPRLHHLAQFRYRASLGFVLSLIALGVGLAASGNALTAPGITLAVCGVFLLPAVAALWWHSRWIDHELRSIRVAPLAHWTFSEEDWRLARLLDEGWRRETSGIARGVGVWLGATLGLIAWLGWLSPAGTLISLASCAAVMALGGGVGWVCGMLAGIALHAWLELPVAPGEVLINRNIVWFSGRLYQLRKLGFNPVAAYCHPGPVPHL